MIKWRKIKGGEKVFTEEQLKNLWKILTLVKWQNMNNKDEEVREIVEEVKELLEIVEKEMMAVRKSG